MSVIANYRESRAIFHNTLQRDLDSAKCGKLNLRLIFLHPQIYYIYLMRKTELYQRVKNESFPSKALYFFWRFRMQLVGSFLGFTIPTGVFGPGLSIAHPGTIVVNQEAIVGNDCRLHPGVTIGAIKGESPVIGSSCFIAPGVVIVGGIKIGNKVSLGPNVVVNFDVPDNSVVRVDIAIIDTKDTN
jgi:serine O-acetyltransferase